MFKRDVHPISNTVPDRLRREHVLALMPQVRMLLVAFNAEVRSHALHVGAELPRHGESSITISRTLPIARMQ